MEKSPKTNFVEVLPYQNVQVIIANQLEAARLYGQRFSFKYNVFEFEIAPDSDYELLLDCYYAHRCEMRAGTIGPYPQLSDSFRSQARLAYKRHFAWEAGLPLTIN